MSTTTIQQSVIYGLGEGAYVADSTALTNALRWMNAAYRELFSRHRFRHIQKRSMVRTADGQGTYQAPSDFMGLLIVKDESNDNIIQQVTPERFAQLKDCDSGVVREYEREDGTRFGKVIRVGNAADPDSLSSTPGLLLMLPGIKDIREYVVPVSELIPPDGEAVE